MKRIVCFLLLSLASSLGLMASRPAGGQEAEVIARINKAASSLKAMSCAFTQTKHLSLLSDKMVSEGRMHYVQPSKLRWEYTSPYQYLFVFNGTQVYVGNKARQDVIDTQTNKVFKEVARIMMSTVTGTALSNVSDFDTSVAETSDEWQVSLVPKKKEMKKMFGKIVLSFAKSDLMIGQIDLYERNGDRTNIKLRDISINKMPNESLFAIPRK